MTQTTGDNFKYIEQFSLLNFAKNKATINKYYGPVAVTLIELWYFSGYIDGSGYIDQSRILIGSSLEYTQTEWTNITVKNQGNIWSCCLSGDSGFYNKYSNTYTSSCR